MQVLYLYPTKQIADNERRRFFKEHQTNFTYDYSIKGIIAILDDEFWFGHADSIQDLDRYRSQNFRTVFCYDLAKDVETAAKGLERWYDRTLTPRAA